MDLASDFIVLIIYTKHLHLSFHCLSADPESTSEDHGDTSAQAGVIVEGDHNVVNVVQHGSSSHVNAPIAAGRFCTLHRNKK